MLQVYPGSGEGCLSQFLMNVFCVGNGRSFQPAATNFLILLDLIGRASEIPNGVRDSARATESRFGSQTYQFGSDE